ncbi:type II toxin-antitoxin system prevent-host-death family antitoxin [Methylobacterium sp. BTF04]|uniref:type II toxin-antitoxin system prevent-host-death family antitoxin n=1 Tax=Methylobacterium sp. BTF04 TaxID=2708300 RepID=UPI0013D4CE60|nr:type II toxin-antitoxin system prevent-host-death family antitoxin [Methylobacterium sp. BTF04]NEU11852.1 type II toxin-antitoxin system prevent-host-death family antitoxin [Methylobacterium sp. BTF04]
MREIRFKDARAKLSDATDEALSEEEFPTTPNGCKDAMPVCWSDGKNLSPGPSRGRLLAASPLVDDDLPDRNGAGLRDLDL